MSKTLFVVDTQLTHMTHTLAAPLLRNSIISVTNESKEEIMDDIEELNAILAEANIPPIPLNNGHYTEDDSDFITVLKQQFQSN